MEGTRTTGGFGAYGYHEGFDFGDNAAGSMSMMTAFIRFSRLGYMGRLSMVMTAKGSLLLLMRLIGWSVRQPNVLEDLRGFSKVVLHMIPP